MIAEVVIADWGYCSDGVWPSERAAEKEFPTISLLVLPFPSDGTFVSYCITFNDLSLDTDFGEPAEPPHTLRGVPTPAETEGLRDEPYRSVSTGYFLPEYICFILLSV